jgi:glycosyltransferase involved in cell wall biosynthesis
MNKSKANLVLTTEELSSIQKIRIKSPSQVLPNGIALPERKFTRLSRNKRVIFCSRLHKRKGIDKFIELADIFRDSEIKFDIYGPDSGELALVESEINSRNLDGILSYMGALPANKVEEVLAEIDLLILPSKDEPFPMVVLEALALGTPVLIMPSCGFANLLGSFDSSFVATSEDIHGLVNSFRSQKENSFAKNTHSSIVAFCETNFAISRVVDQLIATYKNAVSHAE